MDLHRLTELVLALALRLPPAWYGQDAPETPDAYRARVAVIAEAAAAEAAEQAPARPLPLALALTVLWHQESGGFDLRVHAGDQHPVWTQDHGRARCLGQSHVSRLLPRDEWLLTAGTDLDATRRCARATIRLWRAQAGRCAVAGVWDEAHVAIVFGAYARGGGCVPDGRDQRRAAMWAEAMRRARQ